MLSSRHLIFMEVARLLSFTKASQTLFLSQSAISKQIKSLEYFYKTGLFERHGNSISLTQTGQALYAKLLEANQLQEDLHQELQQINEDFSPPTKLAIGASTTISLYVLPPVLSAYLNRYPNIQINVLNRNSTNIQNALLAHDIDIGIVEGLTRINTLVYTPFMTDDVLAVCSARSPLRGRTLTIDDLPTIPLAVRENGSGTLAIMEDVLSKRGIALSALRILIRLGGTEALKNFVLADTCLAFLPKRAILKELLAGELVEVPIQDLPIQRTFYFIQRKGTENSRLVSAFIQFMQRHYSIKE
ncbi:LysR substrate-binding domain-containing protein [Spirosoma endophyticum]|uniref:DNA-binding transcriptional regulator, LysR family n=1 Tax=Spirosoma endophyticum TaxID=662367 RepID=A0A1I2EJ21_9BACT|nr:LysR substrate-binding domain-containing protein [Spirosoma endophyticum]SFE92637.1 DNA-binding transcriptional regulator, LysR family [Spirosoma endophyticum]